MDTVWIVFNIETGKYHGFGDPGWGEFDSPMDDGAGRYESEEDAIEVRDELCYLHCDDIWCDASKQDVWATLDKYAPPGWDWERDGEITDGSQLSGPYVVKKLHYLVED